MRDKTYFSYAVVTNDKRIAAEGPFSKKSRASYLVSYRYSLLELINAVGINLDINPKYQDLNFKINIPNKKGKTTIFGIGGTSQINLFEDKKDQKDWSFENSGENVANGSDIGISPFQRYLSTSRYSIDFFTTICMILKIKPRKICGVEI